MNEDPDNSSLGGDYGGPKKIEKYDKEPSRHVSLPDG